MKKCAMCSGTRHECNIDVCPYWAIDGNQASILKGFHGDLQNLRRIVNSAATTNAERREVVIHLTNEAVYRVHHDPVHGMSGRCDSLQSQVDSLQSQVVSLQQDVASLQNQVTQYKEALERAGLVPCITNYESSYVPP